MTSVRITGVTCTPSPHCSANPRQVSTHGTLLLKGIGLKAGMVLGFPKRPGRRVTTRSPGGAPAQDRARAARDGPEGAHSGHIMVLLSHGRYTSSYGPIYVFKHALHPPPPKAHLAGAAGGVARRRASKARACGSGT